MSLLETFDLSPEIISAKEIFPKENDFPKKVLAVFSMTFDQLIHETLQPKQMLTLQAGRLVPIYTIEVLGERVAYYHSLLGGPASVALFEEVLALGGETFLFFGSAGSLDESITSGHLIVPTMAYRDEGTSYHYAPASDYLKIHTAKRLAKIFDSLNIPHTLAKTWTTDAFYRETRGNMQARKSDGCAVVEMECASLMAAGQFRGASVYQFLYTADCLDGESWDRRILGSMPSDMRVLILQVALDTLGFL